MPRFDISTDFIYFKYFQNYIYERPASNLLNSFDSIYQIDISLIMNVGTLKKNNISLYLEKD